MKQSLNAVFTVAILFLLSCSNSNGGKSSNGDRFLGKWSTGHGTKMEITKDGDNFLVKVENPNFATQAYICKLKDGALVNDGQLGSVNYIESSGHLAGAGRELTKITDTTK